MDQWIAFQGTAEADGSNYRLRGASGGTIVLAKEHVRLQGDKAEIKAGAKAQVSERPQGKKTETASTLAASSARANCPGNKTYCIGLVEFCCENDEALGACIGVWDCS